MTNDNYDVLIVGGGPAGLTAAWQLRDLRIGVLEASDRLGGRLKSLPRGDYWINLGGHLFPGAGSVMQTTLGELGLSTIPIPGEKFAMSFSGAVYSYPRVELYPLLLPMTLRERFALARAGLKIKRAVAGWHGEMEPRTGEGVAAHRARVAAYMSDRSFRDLVGRAPERVDSIFRSTARRAGDEINKQSAGVAASLYGAVWSGGNSTMALNLNGGSGMFGTAMKHELADLVTYGADVTRVEAGDDHVSVSYTVGGEARSASARQVIIATPAAVARKVVAGLPSDVERSLESVTTGPFLVMGVLTSEEGPMPYDNIYAITTAEQSFDMLFNHANPLRGSGTRKPGGSLMMYAGGQPARDLMALTDAQIEAVYLEDLFGLYPQLRGQIAETVIQRWELGNVYRAPGMSFDGMLRYCERPDTMIQFCGDYFGEIGNMVFASESAAEAAGRARSSLSKHTSMAR
jgi:protoporphyrinogen/coproporphyrinogen III oxidase